MTVDFAIADGVAEVVLNDPARRNALGFDTLECLVGSIARAEREGAGAVVLSAVGPVFSAGADFNDLTGTSADIDYDAAVATATAALRHTRLPVIAAVQGPCLGAAVDLVASADLVVAATAARFEVPAVRLGILYNPAALLVMRRRLPGPMLRQLMFGVSISATDAATGGFVARVVDADRLATAAGELALGLSTSHRGALGATKELLDELDAGPVDPQRWAPLRRCLLDTPERHRTIAERRRPNPLNPPPAHGGAQS